MREPDTTGQDGRSFCLRHPDTESNLRCGRCGDLICPRCMVTTPVGARCPNCARIGRPKVLDTSAVEMGRAVSSGIITAIISSAIITAVLWIFDALVGYVWVFDVVVIFGGMIGSGYAVGEAVRIGSGNKLDQRLKYVAMSCAFVVWVMAIGFTAVINLPTPTLLNTFGIIAMVIGVYAAMLRVRIP